MQLLPLAFVIIGNLAAYHSYAQDAVQPFTQTDCEKAGMAWDADANICKTNVVSQPLTRADCVKAGQTWNDNANVCETTSLESVTRSEAAGALGQPLTRRACELAEMKWNDSVNVCGEKSGESAAQTPSSEVSAVSPSILINIDKARQRMIVLLDGTKRYDWPVSTGRPGYATPSGSFAASSMNEIWYSKQWDSAPMPHAVFFTKEGHAIHGTNEVKRLGRPASHGCVRLSPKNAATLYALIAKTGLEKTQVVLVGLTPGGESKVASPVKHKPRYSRAATRSSNPQVSAEAATRSLEPQISAESDVEPQRRRGLFGRLFGRR